MIELVIGAITSVNLGCFEPDLVSAFSVTKLELNLKVLDVIRSFVAVQFLKKRFFQRIQLLLKLSVD